MIKVTFILFVSSLFSLLHAEQRPNILFIAIDDLNDWIGPLSGHPQAKTPNIDRFCDQGSVVFENAVCAAPVCCPSRSAFLSGFLPSSSGVYTNGDYLLNSPVVQKNTTLPEYFSKNGYHTLSTGKIFHGHQTDHGNDIGHWAFDTYVEVGGQSIPDKNVWSNQVDGFVRGKEPDDGKVWKGYKSQFAWAPTKNPIEETEDYLRAKWAGEQFEKDWDKPFLMALGIYRPHMPLYAPKEFFELYKLDTLQLPQINENDLDDILTPSGKPANKPSVDYQWIKEYGLEKDFVQAYLANVSYADACLGMVFDALEESQYADNTIVVFFGDHGWHLGEKLRYRKNTLWAEAVRNPIIMRIPGMEELQYCESPISLIDLYPTLIELCSLPAKELDGRDFSSLLKDPSTQWDHPAITVSNKGTSILTDKWHYIEYLSGTTELYNRSEDPNEWENLAQNPEYKKVIEKLSANIPKSRAPSAGKPIRKNKTPKKNSPDKHIETIRNRDDLL